MTRTASVLVFIIAFIIAGDAATALAQPLSETRIEALIRTAAEQFARQPQPPATDQPPEHRPTLPLWGMAIDPVDQPDFVLTPIDVDAPIRKALASRTDLNGARKANEANGVALKYLRNQNLPQADVVARYGLTGLGGTEYIARARVQIAQAEAQTRQIELQVATDVTNAAMNVQSAIEAVQAARAAQELAQKTMEAEQGKFEVGITTNYNVILTQRDLNTAKNSYLLAVLNDRNALVELDRVQQTTLQSANVTLLAPTVGGTVLSPSLSPGNVGSGCVPSVTVAAPCVP